VGVALTSGALAVVELVGLPGTGKTTVARALASLDAVQVRSRYRTWDAAPAYARSAIRLAPAIASPSRGSSWRDRRRLVRLASSEAIVDRSARAPGITTLVFDQGPVFLLRQLAAAGPPVAGLRAVYMDRWASLLDLVVVLDAPDDALVRRARSRQKDHQLKSVPLEDARQALASERRAQTASLEELAAAGDVPVTQIDTSALDIDETVRGVRRCLDQAGARARRH
jgi:broad-specificity NMP kinase